MRSLVIITALLASLVAAIPARVEKRVVITNFEFVTFPNGDIGQAFDIDGVRTTQSGLGWQPTATFEPIVEREASPVVISNFEFVTFPNGDIGQAFDIDGVRTTQSGLGWQPTATFEPTVET